MKEFRVKAFMLSSVPKGNRNRFVFSASPIFMSVLISALNSDALLIVYLGFGGEVAMPAFASSGIAYELWPRLMIQSLL